MPYEERLIELADEEVANIHLGRSRQDLHGVVRRMLIRDQWLALADGALRARAALLRLAEQEATTPIPAYTHGVQAQPTTLGHYLLAFSASLERDLQRFREGYARMNRSPLGAAALGTSGFAHWTGNGLHNCWASPLRSRTATTPTWFRRATSGGNSPASWP